MNRIIILTMCLIVFLAGCTSTTPALSPTPIPPSAIQPTATKRVVMLPTWTPSPTPIQKATPTPRKTSTALFTPGGNTGQLPIGSPSVLTQEMLIDRPTYAQLPKPAYLVSLQYDPSQWMLNSFYPTSYMGYSLINRSNYGCTLEPSVGKGVEGYEVEKYNRPIGTATYEIARVSQAGELLFANYCTGSGENYSCYQVSPGTDHTTCIQAAEMVLATYKLNTNPFFGEVLTSPNRWICQDVAGTVGLCLISYSIPLNALAFTPDGQVWAVGDDGIILHKVGQAWEKLSSPALHPLYDVSFSSPVNGWAVGAGAEVLHWDGTQWDEKLPYHGSGEGPGGSTQVLNAVEVFSKDDAWMVGAMKGIDGKNSPYALHWNGTDLIEENSFPDCNCGLFAVLVQSQDDIFTAGGSDMGAMIFRWDGTTWSGTTLQGADFIYALSKANDGAVWAAGIEVARDQKDTRGALFRWDGTQWQRIATPPLTGGIYALAILPTGNVVLGGDFTAMRKGFEWQPITTDIAGYQWIVDIQQDSQGGVWALTRSGNIFKLGSNKP